MKATYLRTFLVFGATAVTLACGPRPDNESPFADRHKTSAPPSAPAPDRQVGGQTTPTNGTDQRNGECTNGEALCVTSGASTSYCANLTVDATNCGACGNVCQNDVGCYEGICR